MVGPGFSAQWGSPARTGIDTTIEALLFPFSGLEASMVYSPAVKSYGLHPLPLLHIRFAL